MGSIMAGAGLAAMAMAADGGGGTPGGGASRFQAEAASALELAQRSPERGLAAAEAALAIARPAKERAGEAALEMVAAECLDLLGRGDEAIRRFERARLLYHAIDDPAGEIRALRSLAALHRSEARFEESVATYEQALAIAKRRSVPGDVLAVEHELLHTRQSAARRVALERERWINQLLTALVALAAGAILVGVQRYRARGRMAEQLDHAARHDPLTGLSNRRDVTAELAYEQARSRRSQRSFAVMIADVDDFKKVNDRFGHEAGDAVLIEVARRMRASSRAQDIVGRWGGEEFLFVLPETDGDGGRVLAAKVHQAIGASPVHWRDLEIPVALSLGVAQSAPGLSIDQVIRAADDALLAAKRAGKNRIEISGRPVLPLPA